MKLKALTDSTAVLGLKIVTVVKYSKNSVHTYGSVSYWKTVSSDTIISVRSLLDVHSRQSIFRPDSQYANFFQRYRYACNIPVHIWSVERRKISRKVLQFKKSVLEGEITVFDTILGQKKDLEKIKSSMNKIIWLFPFCVKKFYSTLLLENENCWIKTLRINVFSFYCVENFENFWLVKENIKRKIEFYFKV